MTVNIEKPRYLCKFYNPYLKLKLEIEISSRYISHISYTFHVNKSFHMSEKSAPIEMCSFECKFRLVLPCFVLSETHVGLLC